MAGDWAFPLISDSPLMVIDGDRGKNYPSQGNFSSVGHCLFLNAGNVTSNGFDFTNTAFISEKRDSLLRKGKLERHDVVLTTRGTVGNVAYYDESIPYDHLRINSGMVIFRTDPTQLLPRYLYFYLRSPLFTAQMKGLTTGSAQPQFPIRDINRVSVPLPPLPEQKAIAHILGTLDDKIELNRRMNETLEAMARAIFKSWFVDFDPVRVKAEAKANGTSPDKALAKLGITPDLAPLFPDNFEDSDLGEIPEGWEVKELGDFFNITMGQSPPGTSYNEHGEGIPFYQGRTDYGARFPTRRKFCTAPTRFAEKHDTLVSVRAPVGDVNLASERCCIGRGLAAVRHKSGACSYTLYSMHSLRDRFAHFESEGTVFGSINKKSFHGLKCIDVPERIITRFEQHVGLLDQRYESNSTEMQVHSESRDALLPKLLSGEVRVFEVEAEAVEVENG